MRRDILVSTAVALGAISYYIFSFKHRQAPKAQILPVDIDPTVLSNRNSKPVQIQVFKETPKKQMPVELPPHEQIGFGYDTSRNVDNGELDDYLQLPLEGEGRTYKDTLFDLEERVVRTPERVRYLRMKILKTRGYHARGVSLGGLRFLYKNRVVTAKCINPHTGDAVEFPWADDDQHTILIGFSKAVEIDRYEIQTSGDSPTGDPVHWTLEGSMNGTFWEFIGEWDEQVITLRNVWIPYELEV